MLGQPRPAIETPLKMAFRWRADDGPLLVVHLYFDPTSPQQLKTLGPPLA